MKLWGGRFDKELDQTVSDFNSSIAFDARLWPEDIRGSMAHAAMLGRQGIIPQEDAQAIQNGLTQLAQDIQEGRAVFTADNEDVHMNIETLLTERIGDAGKRLHTARSRNDQVAVDLRLYLKREISAINKLLLSLMNTLCDMAQDNLTTWMPGYTHLQRAQPVSFAHYLMAYANMFRRDVTRMDDCMERMDEMPLGSGALAGTTYPIDRPGTAADLGFARITQNSLDGVSDRDYCVEFLSACSLIMMHLSRFSEEVILWCSWEFKFLELDDAFSTGSSIMPQKKNPDIAELVRGKTGRVYGDLMALLTVMKGLPLAYNKDMQEDKEAVFDAADTIKSCLQVFAAMIKTAKVLPENMAAAANGGFINATDCADYLTRKGMPFRRAYTVVGRLVNSCILQGLTLDTLPLEDYRAASDLFDDDIYQAISLQTCASGRNVPGGPAPGQVKDQIAYIRSFSAQHG